MGVAFHWESLRKSPYPSKYRNDWSRQKSPCWWIQADAWGWLWPRGLLHASPTPPILGSCAVSGTWLRPWMEREYRRGGGMENKEHASFDWTKLKMSEWSAMWLNCLLLCQMEMGVQTEWRYRKWSASLGNLNLLKKYQKCPWTWVIHFLNLMGCSLFYFMFFSVIISILREVEKSGASLYIYHYNNRM